MIITPPDAEADGTLCAGRYYELSLDDASTCAEIQWVAVSAPNGVNPAAVTFTSPRNSPTYVQVPVSGIGYCFKAICKVPA